MAEYLNYRKTYILEEDARSNPDNPLIWNKSKFRRKWIGDWLHDCRQWSNYKF